MSDLNEWIKERRRIHENATQGAWGIGSWRDRVFQHHMTIEPEQGHRTIGDVTDDHRGNATAIVDSHNTLPALLTAVEKVLELHEPIGGFVGDPSYWECNVCGDDRGPKPYPCPTVRAIKGAIK